MLIKKMKRGKKLGSLLFLFSLGFILISLSVVSGGSTNNAVNLMPVVSVKSSSFDGTNYAYTIRADVRYSDCFCNNEDVNQHFIDWWFDGVLLENKVCAECSSISGGTCVGNLPGAKDPNNNITRIQFFGYIAPWCANGGYNCTEGCPPWKSDCDRNNPTNYLWTGYANNNHGSGVVKWVSYYKTFSFTQAGIHTIKIRIGGTNADCGKDGYARYTFNNYTINTDTTPFCGNAVLDTGEQCDDNNVIDGDGCSSTCLIEVPPSHDCSDDSQTIMKLLSQSNSHAALWNDTSYNWDICYDDIFDEDYTGANPHSCSNNFVLWLSQSSNSHASTFVSSSYNVPVCYGNLNCMADTSAGTLCSNPGYKVVARLFNDTNAHVSDAAGVSYPIKVCCGTGVGATVSGLHWENMIGMPINTSRSGASVKAVVAGSGLSGKTVSYEIWKSVKWWWDDKVATSSASGSLTWKAGKNKSGVSEGGEYYFTAKIGTGTPVSSETNDYGKLNVVPGNNVPPVANITSPKDKQIYFLNEPLNFMQASYDIDSTFNWVWDFGDELSVSGNSVSMNNYNVVHAYTTTGQKNIKLNVVDEEGASSMDKVTILIVNSSYILAYIDEPKWGSFTTGTGLTRFNASSTYAVNVTHNSTGIEKIECIAGNCPSKTEGCPPPFTGYPSCQIQVINTPNPAGFENIQFDWVFDNNPLKNQSGKGAGNSVFYKTFEPGVHTAKLTARI